jgi:hypothetical protein
MNLKNFSLLMLYIAVLIGCSEKKRQSSSTSNYPSDKDKETFQSSSTPTEIRNDLYGGSCDTLIIHNNVSSTYTNEKTKRVDICLYWTFQYITMNRIADQAREAGEKAGKAIVNNDKELAAHFFLDFVDTLKSMKEVILSEKIPIVLNYYCDVISKFDDIARKVKKLETVNKKEFLEIVHNSSSCDTKNIKVINDELHRLRDLYYLDKIDLKKEFEKPNK